MKEAIPNSGAVRLASSGSTLMCAHDHGAHYHGAKPSHRPLAVFANHGEFHLWRLRGEHEQGQLSEPVAQCRAGVEHDGHHEIATRCAPPARQSLIRTCVQCPP